jgi:hypothetical protein
MQIAKQIDSFNGTPTTVPKKVKRSAKAEAMNEFGLSDSMN